MSHPSKGGRPKGARDKKPRRTAARKVAEAASASGETPLEYMLRVMRSKNADPRRRDQMATSAAPYVHARLASVDHNGTINHVVDLTKLSDEDLDAYERLTEKLAGATPDGASGADGDQTGEGTTRR